MADYDTTGWTVYEPAECECINAHISSVNTSGGYKPVITLTLFIHDLNRKLVYFCNVNKAAISKKNYSAKPNSNFAKLYRLTIGKNPKFSKSQQLMKHLIGEWFRCEYCQDKDKNGLPYYKVTDIAPLEPNVDGNWTFNGELVRRKKSAENPINPDREKQHPTGTDVAPNWQPIGTDLAPSTAEDAQPIKANEPNPLHKNISHPGVGTSEHIPNPNDYMSIEEKINEFGARESVWTFQKMPDECEDDYLQRVIDASW